MRFIDDNDELTDTAWFPTFKEVWTDKFYKIPFLPWNEEPNQDATICNNMKTCLHTRLLITEKIDGLLFHATREEFEVLDDLNEIFKDKPENIKAVNKLLKDWWEDHYLQIPATIEVFGIIAMYSRLHWYSSLPAFIIIHTVYDMVSSRISRYANSKALAEERLKTPMVPLLLSKEFHSIEELQEVTQDIVNTKSLYGYSNMLGLVVRREEDFMAFSGDQFMAQLNSPKIQAMKKTWGTYSAKNLLDYNSKFK